MLTTWLKWEKHRLHACENLYSPLICKLDSRETESFARTKLSLSDLNIQTVASPAICPLFPRMFGILLAPPTCHAHSACLAWEIMRIPNTVYEFESIFLKEGNEIIDLVRQEQISAFEKSRVPLCFHFRFRNLSSLVRNSSGSRYQSSPHGKPETNMASTRLCRLWYPTSSSVNNAAKGLRNAGIYSLQRPICVRILLW